MSVFVLFFFFCPEGKAKKKKKVDKRKEKTKSVNYPDVGIAGLAVARDSSLVAGVRVEAAAAGDDELGALGVELGRVGLVEGDQLVPDEVVARREALGDGAGPLLVAADELGDVPARGPLGVEEDGLAVALEAGLVDLEPARPGPVARREGPRALVHPHQDRALGVRPLAPDGRDLVARRGRGRERGRRAPVAAHLGVGWVGHGVVVVPLALDDVLGVAGGEALISVRCRIQVCCQYLYRRRKKKEKLARLLKYPSRYCEKKKVQDTTLTPRISCRQSHSW